ncbi:MAG: lipocalin-like domain-containing protein [Longimicrobiales bacterium]
MRSWLLPTSLLIFLAVLGFMAGKALKEPRGIGPRATLSVQEFMGGTSSEGFQRAFEPREFRFPRDHGPHPGFRTEWWYVTGNLEGARGEPYGFQLTLFRSALAPADAVGDDAAEDDAAKTDAVGDDAAGDDAVEDDVAEDAAAGADGAEKDTPASDWRTRQLYMGHFAVTHGGDGRHMAFERFARGAVGLAGAQADPFRVWVGGWELRGPVEGGDEVEGGGIFPLTLLAREGGLSLELSLNPEKPLILQGREGLSQKGPEPGNASFYYSFTRLSASGALVMSGDSVPVTGTAWMDREWSTSALSPGQVGWDWFALQLDDGHDLMYYQLRRGDGTADPLSKGVWVDARGAKRSLSRPHVELEVLDHWISSLDSARYPSAWRLSVPSLELILEIRPVVPDQEMELAFRYWEGAVRVEGVRGGKPVRGVGYVELTGYAESGAAVTGGRRITRTGGAGS